MSNAGAELWVSSSRAYYEAKALEDRTNAASRRDHQYHQDFATTRQASPPAATRNGSGHASSFEMLQPPLSSEVLKAPSARNRRYTSILFYCVAAVHAALFVVVVGLNSWMLEDLYDNPLLGPGLSALQRIGATSASDIANKHQYWRLLVSPFLGAGVLHVWTNMSVLTIFPAFLANDLPLWETALIYAVSGISSVTTSANIGDRYITAAGSGPAFGMLGAACVLLLARIRHLRNYLLTWTLVAFNLALYCFIGATPFVDNSGNTAGFVTGALCCTGMLLLQRSPGSLRSEVRVQVLAALMLCVAILIPVFGIIGLNTGLPLGGCCNAWVCAPSPYWNCGAAYVWPTSCQFTTYVNGTISLTCPQGQVATIPASLVDYGNAPNSVLDAVCQSFCAPAAPSQSLGRGM